MLTVLLPQTVEEPEVRKMVQEAEEVCRELNMEIFGGHTEVTDVVRQPVVSVTGVGKVRKENLLSPAAIHRDRILSSANGLAWKPRRFWRKSGKKSF